MTAPIPTCKEDWGLCKDNSDLVNNFGDYFTIQDACQTEANHEARYGTPVWPSFWSGGPFGTFLNGTDYATTGMVVAIEPDAQFQNGFGAMVHSKVVCKYSLASKKVVSIDIIPH
jgi:hypothetical protein